MSWQPTRDLVGYGPNPPDPKWPGGARVAINFVMNYEEGSEPSMQAGEGYTETGLTESWNQSVGMHGRDRAGSDHVPEIPLRAAADGVPHHHAAADI